MSLLERYRGVYIEYSRTSVHKRRVQKTRLQIEDVLAKHKKPYTAFSTGKDSLCMLDMVYKINPRSDVMFHDSGVELPESYDQIHKVREYMRLVLHVVHSPVNVLEIYRDKDGFMKAGAGDIALTPAMMVPIRSWAAENGNDVAFIGLRKQESKRRRMMLAQYGTYFYAKSNRIYECFPMAEWRGEDIWAYIFSNPPLEEYIHPAYYKDRLVKDPSQIRVSWYCDPAGATRGHYLWLKIYYPEIWDMLRAEFPEVRSYA